MEPRDWIAVAAIAGTVLVGIFSPFLLAMATWRKERRTRLEERRDEAYFKLSLILREEKEGMRQSWMHEDFPLVGVLIPNPDEVSWVEARVALVGSERVRVMVQELRDKLDHLADVDADYRDLLIEAEQSGIDPETDDACLQQLEVVRSQASEAFAAIDDLESVMRAEVGGD